MAYNYQYGAQQAPRPGSIDEELMLRRRKRELDMDLAAKERMAEIEQQNALGLISAKEQAGLDTALEKRRLGLGTLQEQLANPDSDMYGYDGPAVAVSVGNELGPLNAPPPVQTPTPRLGLSPLGLAAVDASRTGNSLTLDEYRQRLLAKQNADIATDTARTQNDMRVGAQRNMSQGAMTAARLQASDLAADKNTVASDAMTTLTQINAPSFRELSPIQAPAFSDEIAPGGGADEKEIMSDDTGTLVEDAQGNRFFIPKGSNERIPFKANI